jgi:hypothetical protein
MSRILPRFYRHQQAQDDAHRLTRILIETGANQPDLPPTPTNATLPGDTRRLRGIPVIARGVTGTSPGTNPGHLDNIR